MPIVQSRFRRAPLLIRGCGRVSVFIYSGGNSLELPSLCSSFLPQILAVAITGRGAVEVSPRVQVFH